MNKGYTGIKSELIHVRRSRDEWKRKYHQLNNLYAQLKEQRLKLIADNLVLKSKLLSKSKLGELAK